LRLAILAKTKSNSVASANATSTAANIWRPWACRVLRGSGRQAVAAADERPGDPGSLV
jgi:hypothetical protein